MFGKAKPAAQDDAAQDSVDDSVDALMGGKSAPILEDTAATQFIMTETANTPTSSQLTPAYPSDFDTPATTTPAPPPLPDPEPEEDEPQAAEPEPAPIEPAPAPEPLTLPPAPDGAARVPVIITQKPMPNPSFVPTNAAAAPPAPPEPIIRTGLSDDLQALKQQALQQLSPLVDQLDQSPEEKYRTTMMMLQATDDQNLVRVAYEAAQDIADDKVRAQALLDVVNEINYFTQKNAQS